jgi:beta-lactamase class A
MQKQKGTVGTAGITRQRLPFLSRYTTILLVEVIAGSLLFYAGIAIVREMHDPSGMLTASNTIASNGATRWIGDQQTTAAAFGFSSPGSQTVGISPLFAHYYTSHSGANSLGTPMTVAFPTKQGWLQFFASGALLLPASGRGESTGTDAALIDLIANGVRESGTGIVRLPLLEALLTAGSRVPVAGDGGALTYVDLRAATSPDLLLTAPAGSKAIFIKGGTRAGKAVGHLIPQQIWSYIQRPAISPDGWQTDFGAPLTEALPFTITINGSVHHMLVQAFWRDALLLDQDTPAAAGQLQISRLATGVAYWRTFGPPPVTTDSQRAAWIQADTAVLLTAPGTGQTIAHIGQHFPLTLLGDSAWNTTMLWYHVQWTVPHHTGSGWVSASAITFTSPGAVPAWASVDVLSPALAAYLTAIGGNVDAVVYDVTDQQYYTYNASARFIMGSSMKVAIMLTFLDMTERQGREPNDREMDLLTTMIENSNNDSASALYYGEIGGADGVANYLQRIGITGLTPDPDAWGYSLVTPLTMVNLLTRLHEGSVLTAHDRTLAFFLMEHIEGDQQVGVGDTAPRGATVAMKDGWLPGPDGQWAMNSSGIVVLGQETYIIAVYTHEQNSLEDGQAIARHVCSTVASLLTSIP